jgi:hypothetical protein
MFKHFSLAYESVFIDQIKVRKKEPVQPTTLAKINSRTRTDHISFCLSLSTITISTTIIKIIIIIATNRSPGGFQYVLRLLSDRETEQTALANRHYAHGRTTPPRCRGIRRTYPYRRAMDNAWQPIQFRCDVNGIGIALELFIGV